MGNGTMSDIRAESWYIKNKEVEDGTKYLVAGLGALALVLIAYLDSISKQQQNLDLIEKWSWFICALSLFIAIVAGSFKIYLHWKYIDECIRKIKSGKDPEAEEFKGRRNPEAEKSVEAKGNKNRKPFNWRKFTGWIMLVFSLAAVLSLLVAIFMMIDPLG